MAMKPSSLAKRTLDYRVLKLRNKAVNSEERTVELDIATETPVIEYDWKRHEFIPRVLLASGAQFPKTRQIPLLDSHSRSSVRSQLGSIRNLTRHSGDGRVSGKAFFSSVAGDEFTKVREGHVTDASAGFHILKEEYVAEGEKRVIDGKAFEGPINVATKWRLYEGSIVPIGADEAAKMRGLDPATLFQSEKESITVNPELRKLCVSRGMDATLDDKAALEWLNANFIRVMTPEQTPPATPPAVPPAGTREAAPPVAINVDEVVNRAVSTAMTEFEKREELRQKAIREQREAFERDVDATLKLLYGETIDSNLRAACLMQPNMDSVRTHLANLRKTQEEATRLNGGYIVPTGSQRDAHRGALQTAFLVRAFEVANNGSSETRLPAAQRQAGWEQFRNMRLLDLARECLMADGYTWADLRHLSPEQLAKASMGWPERVGLRTAGGYAYHTSGSLTYITQDAINKTLLMGYNEAPVTWRGPFRQASSASDFKQIHRIKLSAVGNLPVWLDNSDPKKAALANEEERYAVEARALCIDFSWQLIVNDDMNALSRAPALLGAAAARTVNAVVWAQLTSNPTLSDGQALFLETPAGNRKRSNLTTGAATPTNTSLAAMREKMRLMRGLNTPEGNESQDILNLSPRYILAPVHLEELVLKQILSGSDPANTNNTVYNTARSYVPVIEPLLDVASTSAWYLAADPSQIDTIEVTFLAGQETPVTSDYVNEKTWSREVTVVQTFAAKAIDHRGLQKHNGA